METFTTLKPFVDNPFYQKQREKSLGSLDINTIDEPISELIRNFAQLPYCFTLQSCYGHFVCHHQEDPKNLEPLFRSNDLSSVEYRIAYIALCIQNSDRGRQLLQDLKAFPSMDPDYVQFGCAEWFWKEQVNSYALQVEPERHKTKDKVVVSFQEALHIEKVRNKVFSKLIRMIQKKVEEGKS